MKVSGAALLFLLCESVTLFTIPHKKNPIEIRICQHHFISFKKETNLEIEIVFNYH